MGLADLLKPVEQRVMKQVTCIIRSDVADSWPMTGYSSPIRVMEGLPTIRSLQWPCSLVFELVGPE